MSVMERESELGSETGNVVPNPMKLYLIHSQTAAMNKSGKLGPQGGLKGSIVLGVYLS